MKKSLFIKNLSASKKWLLVLPLVFTLLGCGTELVSKYLPGTISTEQLNQVSAYSYQQTLEQSKVMPAKNATVIRLRKIADRIIAIAPEYNQAATNWAWQVNLLDDPTLNASCYPNGRIVFYTGIINTLKLTDDEIAMIMGHEVVHALEEHALYAMNKAAVMNKGFSLASEKLGSQGGDIGQELLVMGNQMLGLTFGRADEKSSDLIGQELAAKAGYNPAAAVTVWEKMQKLGGASVPEYMSTHPKDENRVAYLKENLPKVQDFYKVGLAKRQQDEKKGKGRK